jgi:hypothetical protein
MKKKDFQLYLLLTIFVASYKQKNKKKKEKRKYKKLKKYYKKIQKIYR